MGTPRISAARRRVRAVFAAWGTCADVCRDLGLSYWTCASWERREKIPQRWWPEIVARARLRGIDDRPALRHIVNAVMNQRTNT